MKAGEVCRLINEKGGKGEPFLFAIDFELREGIFIPRPMEQEAVLFRTTLGGNRPLTDGGSGEESRICFTPLPYRDYLSRFNTVMKGLLRGDSYLTNLTVRTPVTLGTDLKEIFLATRSPYGLYVPGRLACFSPERFVRIANGVISTNPMKGTISAAIPGAAQLLLDDPKELAEHCTIVDLLRNDIGMVASDVKVARFRYIDRITAPAGSVSGAPKRSTVELIRRAEPELRGFYTGVFGYFDGEEVDSAVIIRYIGLYDGQPFYHSGGGITVNSLPRNEYEEALKKIYLPTR